MEGYNLSHKNKNYKEERSNKSCDAAVLKAFLDKIVTVLKHSLIITLVKTSDSSHSSRRVSFIIPFQLSPVAILNRVRYAIPNDLK